MRVRSPRFFFVSGKYENIFFHQLLQFTPQKQQFMPNLSPESTLYDNLIKQGTEILWNVWILYNIFNIFKGEESL